MKLNFLTTTDHQPLNVVILTRTRYPPVLNKFSVEPRILYFSLHECHFLRQFSAPSKQAATFKNHAYKTPKFGVDFSTFWPFSGIILDDFWESSPIAQRPWAETSSSQHTYQYDFVRTTHIYMYMSLTFSQCTERNISGYSAVQNLCKITKFYINFNVNVFSKT